MYHRKRVEQTYAEPEIAALKIAKIIDPMEKYHINGSVETVQDRSDTDQEPLWTIKFPYGGKDLTKLPHESPEVIVKVLQALPDLMTGISLFHDRNLYHRDLKPNNIVYDTECRVRVIDFGIAILSDNNNQDDDIYTNIYTLWPFETFMLSGQKDIFNDNIYGEYISDEYYQKIARIHHMDTSEYKHNIIALRRAFRDQPDELYKTITKSIDVYSMGVTLSHLVSSRTVIAALGKIRQRQVLKVCRRMIEPYTKERITMDKAAQKLKDIFTN